MRLERKPSKRPCDLLPKNIPLDTTLGDYVAEYALPDTKGRSE